VPGPASGIIKEVVESLIRATGAASREHSRFERQLKATGDQVEQKMDQAVLQLGRSLLSVEKEVDEIRTTVREPLLRELASTHGDLQRCRASRVCAIDSTSWGQWADVVMIIADRLDRTLQRWGIACIPTDGASYDVKLHQTMERRSVAGVLPDRVLQEIEPGYYFPGTGQVLVRARVIVSGGSVSPGEDS
jgi:molecular chaperone GrpE (heat shock protein)